MTKKLKIDWIREEDANVDDDRIETYRPRVLMIGSRDLKQVSQYLTDNFEIVEEYNTVVGGYEIRTSNVVDLVNQLKMPKKLQNDFVKKFSFMANEITYQSSIFDSGFDNVLLFHWLMTILEEFIRMNRINIL